jgi:hypothetical protein
MAVLGLLFITVGHGVWCDFNQRSGGGQSKVGGGEAVGDEVGRCKQQPVLACRWRGCSADGATGKGRGAQGGEEKWGERERDWRGDKVSVASVSRGVVGLPLW